MSIIDLPADRRAIRDPTRQQRTRLSCRIESLSGPAPPVTILFMAGEIDSGSRSTAEAALGAALDHAPGSVRYPYTAAAVTALRGSSGASGAEDPGSMNTS